MSTVKDGYIINGKLYLDHGFVDGILQIRDGKLHRLEETAALPEDARVYDAKGCFVAPGFIDIHTHGAMGTDVNAATAQDLEAIGRFMATRGTTSWLCSILTDTTEQTEWCIDQVAAHRASAGQKEYAGANLLGIHLEGPFLAAEYKGAMPEHLLQKANVELLRRYQNRARGAIRYLTVSPEAEGVVESIPEFRKLGMVVAIGHSGAEYETAMAAIARGAAAATHTMNAMKMLHQHFPGILGAVLESEVYCEIICDGRHLHPGIVRLLLKTKGTDRVIAVTDSIMAAGLPDGNYRLGVNDVVVSEGDAKLADTGVRAGSTLTMDLALINLLTYTGRPLEELLPLLTENPATLLGIQDRKGFLRENADADLVILTGDGRIRDVFIGGTLLGGERTV